MKYEASVTTGLVSCQLASAVCSSLNVTCPAAHWSSVVLSIPTLQGAPCWASLFQLRIQEIERRQLEKWSPMFLAVWPHSPSCWLDVSCSKLGSEGSACHLSSFHDWELWLLPLLSFLLFLSSLPPTSLGQNESDQLPWFAWSWGVSLDARLLGKSRANWDDLVTLLLKSNLLSSNSK